MDYSYLFSLAASAITFVCLVFLIKTRSGEPRQSKRATEAGKELVTKDQPTPQIREPQPTALVPAGLPTNDYVTRPEFEALSESIMEKLDNPKLFSNVNFSVPVEQLSDRQIEEELTDLNEFQTQFASVLLILDDRFKKIEKRRADVFSISDAKRNEMRPVQKEKMPLEVESPFSFVRSKQSA